eukprot:14756072-Ditylum_brightwellii.AAC.1
MENEQGENKNKEKKMSVEDGEDANTDKELLTKLEEVITSTSSDKAKARIILVIKNRLRTRKQKLFEQHQSLCSSEELEPGENDISQK